MHCPSCQTVNAADAVNCASCGRILKMGVGTVLANRYEIQQVLGQGGMGTVYRAYDRVLEETVAIKVLRPEMIADEGMAKRFLAEIKTARKIAHRNVCRIHEYGEDRGLRFISMAYVEGVDLKHVLKETGALPPADAFEVAIRVAEALEAIHAEGIVHRDLKTPNIMRDAKGVVRVMDFGIAKDESNAGMTQTGMIMGTPEYMSPEQALGNPLDFRSDLYALGVVIFELFTGGLPFRSETPMATLMKQIQAPPPLDGPEAERIPPAVLPILRRLLAKDPAERHPSTEALIEDLKQARAATLGGGTTPAPYTGATAPHVVASTPTPVPMPTLPDRAAYAPPPIPVTAPPPYVPPPAPQAQTSGSRAWLWILGGLAVLGLGFVVVVFVGLAMLGGAQPDPAASPVASLASPAASSGEGTAPPVTQPDAPAADTTSQETPEPAGEETAGDGGSEPVEGEYVPQQDETTDDEPVAAEPESASWLVAHDHGAGFQTFCAGALTVSGSAITFQGNEHRFTVRAGQIREAKRNDIYGAAFGAFHIKLKNGQNYNLAHVTRTGQPLAPNEILAALQLAR